jgi:hypothetical protein
VSGQDYELLVILLVVAVYIALATNKLVKDRIDKHEEYISQILIHSVQPQVIDILPNTEKMAQLAIDLWRLENRIKSRLSDDKDIVFIENSVEKVNRFLSAHNISIEPPKLGKYNAGLNYDVIQFTFNSKAAHDSIVEILEPTIFHEGVVIRKAKVIVETNSEEK